MIRARLTALYRRVLSYPAAGAGVPGLASAAADDVYRIPRSHLSRRGRRALAARERDAMTVKLSAATPSPIAPRVQVVADITAANRARRTTTGV